MDSGLYVKCALMSGFNQSCYGFTYLRKASAIPNFTQKSTHTFLFLVYADSARRLGMCLEFDHACKDKDLPRKQGHTQGGERGCGTGRAAAPHHHQNRNVKNTDFVDKISKVLRDLLFS
jgi:hypothetical protein